MDEVSARALRESDDRDRDEACIDACRKRFESDSRITCQVNDGRSLAMIDDESVDFALQLRLARARLRRGFGELPGRVRPDARSGRCRLRPPLERRAIPTLLRAPEAHSARPRSRPSLRAGLPRPATLESARHDCAAVPRVVRGGGAPVHRPGGRQLEHTSADRLPLDLHETVISLGATEPRPRESTFHGGSGSDKAPSAFVLSVDRRVGAVARSFPPRRTQRGR